MGLDKRIFDVYIVNAMNYIRAKTPSNPLTHQTQRFQDLLHEIIQCCQHRILFESEKFGLPQAELRCLILFEGERYLTVKGIAGKMNVAKSRVTKILEGLVKKGLINRIDDPKDGRVKLLRLTPEAKKKTNEINKFSIDAHQKVMLEMGPSERKTVLSSLELLRSCMDIVRSQLKG